MGSVRKVGGLLSKTVSAVFLLLAISTYASEQVSLYPDGKLEVSEQEQRDNHPVIIDLMKKVNGTVTSKGARWLNGELNRQLLLVAPGHGSEVAFDFYRKEFEQQGINTLFSCSSYSCGSSNFWANDVFEIARLYGQDRQQYYYIGEKSGSYYSVYTVRRGNGRVYALVDVFTPKNSATENKQSDRYDLIMTQPAVDTGFAQLQKKLNENKSLSVVLQLTGIVSDNLDAFDRQQQRLIEQGRELEQLLTSNGVGKNRFRITVTMVDSVNLPADLTADSLWIRVFELQQ